MDGSVVQKHSVIQDLAGLGGPLAEALIPLVDRVLATGGRGLVTVSIEVRAFGSECVVTSERFSVRSPADPEDKHKVKTTMRGWLGSFKWRK